jgi:hypothetical protein
MFCIKIAKIPLFAAALLCATLPALATEETNSGATGRVAPIHHATINCPGVTSVPMTADAEQALPMHVVAILACEAPVLLLGDSEGYTIHVRLSDGTEGYVARMYLNTNRSSTSAAIAGVQATTAVPLNNIVRWKARAPGCDQFSVKGYNVESATANGITVQVSLQDSGWKLRATIAISNEAGKTVEVQPVLVTLDELQPGLKPLPALDPAKLGHVVNHEMLWTQANAQPSPSAQSLQPRISSTSYHADSPNIFIDRTVPASTNTRANSAPAPSELDSLALKQTELASGQKTTGVIWFQRDPSARELSLRVPVGDLMFDFPLSFNPKK